MILVRWRGKFSEDLLTPKSEQIADVPLGSK